LTAARARVLFVVHDASRTGAPIQLLNFLRRLKSLPDLSFEFDVMLKRGGEMETEFEKLVPVVHLHPESAKRRPLAWRVARRLGFDRALASLHRASLRRRFANVSLVYSSTLTNGEALDLFDGRDCAVVTHVHELESWIRRAGAVNFASIKRYTTRYIAASRAVKTNLVVNHGVADEDIDVIHEFINVAEMAAVATGGVREEIRARLGVPSDSIVFGGMGTTDWRKGTDLFLHVARIVRKSPAGARARFIWVGGDGPNGVRHQQLAEDVAAAGLEGYVHLVPPQTNPTDWLDTFDVFVLTSREDPYPLVCLEAASRARPTLCFAGAGGEPEFVEDDSGFVVPYLDVAAMAARAVELIESPGLRARLGATAKTKAIARHDMAVGAPQLLAVLEALLGGNGKR
jgi:glycosyltransferase involved in cell wall biosynthesis